jgi:hypothetical protein
VSLRSRLVGKFQVPGFALRLSPKGFMFHVKANVKPETWNLELIVRLSARKRTSAGFVPRGLAVADPLSLGDSKRLTLFVIAFVDDNIAQPGYLVNNGIVKTEVACYNLPAREPSVSCPDHIEATSPTRFSVCPKKSNLGEDALWIGLKNCGKRFCPCCFPTG